MQVSGKDNFSSYEWLIMVNFEKKNIYIYGGHNIVKISWHA